uniref:Glutaredoxin-2, mitochondrial n=1 Tax=Phallusia mammillata TaxID=59560 RepID=A0A6F9DD16_9ASCI|nr:glutaredoxin-like [Phallusia mammillata]
MGGTVSDEVKLMVKNEIESHKVMVFSKTTCPYCVMAKNALKDAGVPYEVMELDQRSDGGQIQQVLQDITGASTVPRVFINGKCIGGGTETKAMQKNGQLLKLFQA